MKNRRSLVWIGVALLAGGALAGCSRDPNVRKQKYVESGKRYLDSQKYREASIQFLNAIKVDPRFAEAHYMLAQSYHQQGLWLAAYQELVRTTEVQPDNLKAQIDLGGLQLAARHFKEAQEKAEFVIAKDPKNVDAHILLA